MIKVDFSHSKDISKDFYGLFLEDINFAADGGLNNNQINNNSFEARVSDFKHNFAYYYFQVFHARRRFMTRYEREEFACYWTGRGVGNFVVSDSKGLNANNTHYAVVSVGGEYTLSNCGFVSYNGITRTGKNKRKLSCAPSVGVHEGHVYDFSMFAQNVSFVGTINVYVQSASGQKLTDVVSVSCEKAREWTKFSATVPATATGLGSFCISFVGSGSIMLDDFYFGESDYWHAGDMRWSAGRLRRDLTQLIADLQPKFLRFPGGCLVEGYNLENSYCWKDTVGPTHTRKQKFNLWGEGRDGAYMQSYHLGFYEYFLLSEDIGASPLPILNAGLACQARLDEKVTEGDAEFQKRLQDILDLIEFAIGKPDESEWAKLRADMGHPEPFALRMIGIGNENWGDVYNKNFDLMCAAVQEKYPNMDIVWSVGFDCYRHPTYEERRAHFDTCHSDCIVDDHFYRKPEWLVENANLYDDYDRSRARIFLGEYAANNMWNDRAKPNNYYSALSEAAFLTGLERNADIVVMSSYAPLLSRCGAEQWMHNMINYNSLYCMRTVNYAVQKLFFENYGTRYFAHDTGNKEVFSSITTDENYVYIKCVNVSRAAQTVQYDMQGIAVDSRVERSVLECEDDYRRNVFDANGKPQEMLTPLADTISLSDNTILTADMPARSVNVYRLRIAR